MRESGRSTRVQSGLNLIFVMLVWIASPLVFAAPPVADIHELTYVRDQAPVDLSFSYTDSSCDERPCTYNWDFGDGTTLTFTEFVGSTFNHSYTEAGVFTINLTIIDNLGQTDSDTMTIEVLETETLTEYVNECKAALNFDDEDIPNDLNCANGHLFARDSGVVNDFVDYRRVTDKVDLVFACRWLQNGIGDNETFEPPFHLAESVEMLVHNRENGNTCFFKAKSQPVSVPDGRVRLGVPVTLVSPTVAASASPGTYNAEFWANPIETVRELPCAQCHVAGPYIATPRIAPFLQRFGLLNDGHDTFGRIFKEDGKSEGKYFAVGHTLGAFNEILAENNVQEDSCGNSACHSLGLNSTINDVQRAFRGGRGTQLLPAIQFVINGADPEISVAAAGVMPPHDPHIGSPNSSPYTWINRDNPYSPGDGGDIETFAAAKEEYSTLLSYCEDPGYITAHVVDSDVNLKPNQLLDTISVFNAQDGLICLTSEQTDGQCNDYRVRYQCTDSKGITSMTAWYNTDSPSYGGDYERRSNHANVCTGKKVTGIQTSATISTGWTSAVPGPVDRLAQFDRYGLVCNNSDQTDGQCSNYVVQFSYCSDGPEAYTTRISSIWSGRLLTATGTDNNAATKAQPANSSWNSQDWTVEPELGTGYVRLKNMWTGKYLNVESNNENALIVTYDYVKEWGSQQWILEPISGSSDVRLKNVWTGKYLTVVDTSAYATIRSQSLNSSWSSQRWKVHQ